MTTTATKKSFQKSTAMSLADMIEYSDSGVVSKQVLKSKAGNITLFSLDEGQGLSEHTVPFDAMAQILDGKAEITIGGQPLTLRAGQTVIMPANVPHSLHAPEKFKMLLTMIKG